MVGTAKITSKDFNVWFGKVHALKNTSLAVYEHEILGIIGPSNSGKTTFLRALNRLNDLQTGFHKVGSLELDGKDIFRFDVSQLRRKVGMVFALPLPLPLSIFENVCYGPRMQGMRDKKKLMELVEDTLTAAYLWDEVKDRLDSSALKLSGGQQQRLCIARTLALRPEVILFDEPCSGLDPISTAKVEEAMHQLKQEYTIVLVTNNTKQAARVADRTAFFLMGELVEIDSTGKLFTTPRDKRTEDYIIGRWG
jgi:phosphate transport system ATP-binding protein